MHNTMSRNSIIFLQSNFFLIFTNIYYNFQIIRSKLFFICRVIYYTIYELDWCCISKFGEKWKENLFSTEGGPDSEETQGSPGSGGPGGPNLRKINFAKMISHLLQFWFFWVLLWLHCRQIGLFGFYLLIYFLLFIRDFPSWFGNMYNLHLPLVLLPEPLFSLLQVLPLHKVFDLRP